MSSDYMHYDFLDKVMPALSELGAEPTAEDYDY